MRQGLIISGIAHIALILWLLFGGYLQSYDEPEFSSTDVTILTAEEFERLLAPDPAEGVAPPEPAPEPEPVDVEAEEIAEAPVVETEAPVIPGAPEVDEAPEINPVLDDAAPVPAPRVAPEPVTPPETDVPVADELQLDTSPAEALDVPQEEQQAAAPEAAATEIVTEAEEQDDPGRAAPTTSPRPPRRPDRPRPVETAEPEPEPQPEPEPETDPITDAIADTVADAAEEAPVDRPVGPPLSRAEKGGFRVSVQQCWNVDVGSEASQVTVVVGMDMNQDGTPVTNSIRLISSEGGSDRAVDIAFQAARRAILRCQRGGYDLPIDKYAHWREIEITFNPENMRTR